MKIESLYSPHKAAMRDLISAIHDQIGLLPQFYWPADMLGAEMATAEAVGIFEGEELAGFILYREVPGAWEISLVATHPKFQRRGLMEKLIQHLIAAKGQRRELWLEVHESNHSAQKLYEKLGFKLTGRRPRYYKDGATALLYSCP
ncbi:GNAT family N-acetyltransferase [Bdellovibrio sp. SKB1291214]|uniref:GNAT family N-acetyltransferase n=1 Tax=Bdellovibrio sp. SKB1291214 TaxID=1732569 RepID=UPI000B51DCD8|nr:GNAT family N-acetyltransferase [Bdellovibrio sp. SKB1291214]UYL08486.1 GNAT family N-acetyltransferase [Bdellovibrio sp. SKB1291214]